MAVITRITEAQKDQITTAMTNAGVGPAFINGVEAMWGEIDQWRTLEQRTQAGYTFEITRASDGKVFVMEIVEFENSGQFALKSSNSFYDRTNARFIGINDPLFDFEAAAPDIFGDLDVIVDVTRTLVQSII